MVIENANKKVDYKKISNRALKESNAYRVIRLKNEVLDYQDRLMRDVLVEKLKSENMLSRITWSPQRKSKRHHILRGGCYNLFLKEIKEMMYYQNEQVGIEKHIARIHKIVSLIRFSFFVIYLFILIMVVWKCH